VNEARQRYYGKYRGTVVNPVDLGMKGRILAMVSVGGTPLQVVAEACTPYPGFYAIPPTGSGVWIEFEEGDLDKPIWTGCWWKEGEVLAMLSPDLPPATPATAPQTVVLSVSAAGFPAAIPTARLKLNTVTGIATLETLLPPATPALPTRVQITPAFIEISYGIHKIRVTPAGIILNDGALTVI
jgi:type VI secretion system (T6SS) baseplate-like injector VgrG